MSTKCAATHIDNGLLSKTKPVTCLCGSRLRKQRVSEIDYLVQCNQCRVYVPKTSDIVYHCNHSNGSHEYIYDLCSMCFQLELISSLSTRRYTISRNAKYHFIKIFAVLIFLCLCGLLGIYLNHWFLMNMHPTYYPANVYSFICFGIIITAIHVLINGFYSHIYYSKANEFCINFMVIITAILYPMVLISISSFLHIIISGYFGITQIINVDHSYWMRIYHIMIVFISYNIIFILVLLFGGKILQNIRPLIYCVIVGVLQWIVINTICMIYLSSISYPFVMNSMYTLILCNISWNAIKQIIRENKVVFQYDPYHVLNAFNDAIWFIKLANKWCIIPIYLAIFKCNI